MKYKYEQRAERNYLAEAKAMISKLKFNQLYEMYEIVSSKLKYHNSEERDKELNAVKEAIECVKGIDEYRLKRIWSGYSSNMAKDAKPKDGFTKPNKKRV